MRNQAFANPQSDAFASSMVAATVDQGKPHCVRLYTATVMAEVTYHPVVWIGVVGSYLKRVRNACTSGGGLYQLSDARHQRV